MRSYGTVVVIFAGGVGITHQLLYVRELVLEKTCYGFALAVFTSATKKLSLSLNA